jgi:hypothetical protein
MGGWECELLMEGHSFFRSPGWSKYVNYAFPLQCFPFQDVHPNPNPLEEGDKDHQFLSEEPLQLLALQVMVVYFQIPMAQ